MSTSGEPGDPVADPMTDAVLVELEDYLRAGRTPPNPRYEGDPELRRVLDALENLHRVSAELVATQSRGIDGPAPGWVHGIMANIVLEARSGRAIPLTAITATDTLSVTEGALRAQLREAGDSLPGVLIGRCRLVGEITEPTAPITVTLTVSVAARRRIPELTATLRATVIEVLGRHSELRVARVDIRVVDLHEYDVGPLGSDSSIDVPTESEGE